MVLKRVCDEGDIRRIIKGEDKRVNVKYMRCKKREIEEDGLRRYLLGMYRGVIIISEEEYGVIRMLLIEIGGVRR